MRLEYDRCKQGKNSKPTAEAWRYREKQFEYEDFLLVLSVSVVIDFLCRMLENFSRNP